MRLKVMSMCFLVCIVCVVSLSLAAFADEAEAQKEYKWCSRMRDGIYLLSKGECDKALGVFENAHSLSPSDEHKADALLYVAKSYEGAYRRSEAIATYKRIIEECPDAGHLAQVYFRLGEVHRSITLVSPEATEAEELEVLKEMTNEVAVPCFEKAIEAGPPHDRYVLSSKLYLAGIYPEVGRDEESRQILHEMSTTDVYDVKEPGYVGPFKKMNDTRVTLSERLDETRRQVLTRRGSARRYLVHRSLVPGNPVTSIANLQGLVERYAGTEIEEMAAKKIEEMSAILAAETAPIDVDEALTVEPSE